MSMLKQYKNKKLPHSGSSKSLQPLLRSGRKLPGTRYEGFKMKKAALYNLGCKVNSYEMEVMQQNLAENGYLIVPYDEVADIYIVNTCTITNTADLKSRKMLNRARKLNPEAIVVAVGCFVQADEESLKEASIDLAIGNNRKKDLILLLNEYLNKRTHDLTSPANDKLKTLDGRTIKNISREKMYEEMNLKKTANHTRAFIKIQDGCNQFCAYCIIPYVRGPARSRAAAAVIEELTELVNNGCREAVLTGINISAYGDDLKGTDSLLKLITKITAIPGLSRLRLGSLEPRAITAEFARNIALIPQICPHFHLSLQSGCDATLKRMNRRYTSAEYYDKVTILREAYQAQRGVDYEPALTTDIIVGFPGESEAEFNETVNFLEQAAFTDIHIFKYSKRKGTAAATMPGQISTAVKKARSNRLQELKSQMSEAYRRRFTGRRVTFIPEELKIINAKKYWLGYTDEYLRIATPHPKTGHNPIKPGIPAPAIISGNLTAEIMLATPLELLP